MLIQRGGQQEALAMLKEGIERQYEPADGPNEAPVGRVAKRKAGYADAIGGASDWKDRLDQVVTDDVEEEDPVPVGVRYDVVTV